jgi:hypothetical protein
VSGLDKNQLIAKPIKPADLIRRVRRVLFAKTTGL